MKSILYILIILGVASAEEIVVQPDISVVATRWEEEQEETPAVTEQINIDKAQLTKPQTTADLLESSPQIDVQKSQQGGGSPMMRGFAANRILLVVDGVRMNNAIFRSGNLQNVIALDAQGIESAEVLFGPGSVLYGSDALGGVVYFSTTTPKYSADGMKFDADGTVRFSSANYEKTGTVGFSFGWKKIAIQTRVTLADFDDLKMGENGDYAEDFNQDLIVVQENGKDTVIASSDPFRQKPSGYQQLNIMQKVHAAPSDMLDLVYGFHLSTSSDIPRYDRVIQPKGDGLKNAEWYYGPQFWMMHNLNVRFMEPAKIYDEFSITTAWQRFKESRYDRKFDRDTRRAQEEQVDAITLNVDLYRVLGSKGTLYYGIEGVYNYVGSESHTINIKTGERDDSIPTRYPDAGSHYGTAAAYAQYRHLFSEKVSTQLGARYSFVAINSIFDKNKVLLSLPYETAELYTGAFSGSGGLALTPGKGWKWQSSLSSGFRAPNVDDMSKLFESGDGVVVVPNENLEPEYALTLDTELEKRFGDKLTIRVVGFATQLWNVMVRGDYQLNGQDSIVYDGEMSKVQAVVNSDRGILYGASGDISFTPMELLSFRTYINWVDGEEGNGDPLRHVTPLSGGGEIGVTVKRFDALTSVKFNGGFDNEDLAPSEQDKGYLYAKDENGLPFVPAWWTLNLDLGFKITEKVSISGGVHNILDMAYRTYSSGISAPGRSFSAAVRAEL